MVKYLFGCLLLGILFTACRQAEPATTPRPLPTGPALSTAVPTHSEPTPSLSAAGSLLAEAIDLNSPPSFWPPPVEPLPALARTAVSPAQQAAATAWQEASAPDRDDYRLAGAYRGLLTDTFTVNNNELLAPGVQTNFKITRNNSNEKINITATLLGSSDHAYFWFDTTPGGVQPEAAIVTQVGEAFDQIYEAAVDIFGPELSPGLDGEEKVHIVTASPLSMCDVTLATIKACAVAGYFNSTDSLPTAVYPPSNERDMFVMNAEWFGTDFFLNVLGHEFRHMIEDNYDKSDMGWEIEGSATLAEDLLGYPANALERGNRFLENPDLALNSWSNQNTMAHYGQGYLLNRYIYDQFGPDRYRQFVQHPADGLSAVDALSADQGLPVTGISLWLDWLVALAIHNQPGIPDFYQFGRAGLATAAGTAVSLPETVESSVAQYGADYYEIPAGDPFTLTFTGSTAVPSLPLSPVSGEAVWLSKRGNYHNPRLTRTVDLTAVDQATLSYAAFIDMEYGYDFAYVSVSLDDGGTWQPLVAPQMQGKTDMDDPGKSALAGRFYTGQSHAWVQESIDLSAFTGNIIQLRFEYVTDPAVNYTGFALDNIAIPEIGFFDDAEADDAGWLAEGFVRTTAVLPQSWHLQLITFPDGQPTVIPLPLNPDQTGNYLIETQADEQRPLLIVAATAPNTLQPAYYQFSVTPKE